MSRQQNMISGGIGTRVEPSVPLMISSTIAADGDKAALMEDSSKMNDSTNGTPPVTTVAVTSAARTTIAIKKTTTRGPCSNDNPDWELETLPCLGNDDIFDGALSTSAASTTAPTDNTTTISTAISATTAIVTLSTTTIATTTANFEGNTINESSGATPSSNTTTVQTAISTASSVANKTTPIISPTPSISTPEDDIIPASALPQEEHPPFFSCTATSREEFGTDDGGDENFENISPLYLRYNYEIYTPADAGDTDITMILAKFENDLTYGVAYSLGLADCPQNIESGAMVDMSFGESSNADISLKQASFEPSSHGEEKAGGNRKARSTTHRISRDYMRRTLHNEITTTEKQNYFPKGRKLNNEGAKSNVNNGDSSIGPNGILGLSLEPSDEIDTTLLRCTSTVELNLPHKCTPIHGFLTAWYNKAEQQRLRRALMSGSKEDMLLTMIKNYIEQNQTDYLTADVSSISTYQLYHVEFVGEREISIGMINPEVLARPVPQESKVAIGNVDSGGFKAGIIGIASGAALLVIVAIGVVWATRHKRSRRAGQDDEDAEFDSRDVASPKGLGSPSSSEFGRGSWSGDEEDGSFPTIDNARSTAANRSGSFDSGIITSPRLSLADNESDCDDNHSLLSSSSYQHDENVPSNNLFGLSAGDRSDLTTSSTISHSETVVASNTGAFDTAPQELNSVYLVDTVSSDDDITESQGDNGRDENVLLGSFISDEQADRIIESLSSPRNGTNEGDVDANGTLHHSDDNPEQIISSESGEDGQQVIVDNDQFENGGGLDKPTPSELQGNEAERGNDGEDDDDKNYYNGTHQSSSLQIV